MMYQPGTPDAARRTVRRNLSSGADLTKLFTGSWVQRGHVLPMPLDIAKAAAEESHLNGKLVFAHPSNLAGMRVAIDGGVDVLAHAADDTRGVDQALLSDAVHKNMAMIPTLKMFASTVTTDSHYMDPICAEVHTFHALGGQLLFGTDVGYMRDYTTDLEFVELGKSGLDWKDVLAMLTTNPSARMGVSNEKGTVAPGKLADLTILSADPAQDLDPQLRARVKMVIRSGRVIDLLLDRNDRLATFAGHQGKGWPRRERAAAAYGFSPPELIERSSFHSAGTSTFRAAAAAARMYQPAAPNALY